MTAEQNEQNIQSQVEVEETKKKNLLHAWKAVAAAAFSLLPMTHIHDANIGTLGQIKQKRCRI